MKKFVVEKLSVYSNVYFATLIDPSAIISALRLVKDASFVQVQY